MGSGRLRVTLGLCLFGGWAAAQDAGQILRSAVQTLASFHSYRGDLVQHVEATAPGGGKRSADIHTTVAFARPDRLRVDTGQPGLKTLVLSDGHTLAILSGNHLTRRRAVAAPEFMFDSASPGLPEVLEVLDKPIASRLPAVHEETLSIGGREHPCWMIEARGDFRIPGTFNELNNATVRLWIGKSDRLMWKSSISGSSGMSQLSVTSTIESQAGDVDLADETFHFTAPPGITENLLWMPAGFVPPLQGYAAPAFTMESSGQKISLEDLRGKTTLLDFVGTSCEPCQSEEPVISRANNARSTVLMVHADQPRLEQLFHVRVYPTRVIINPEGRVTAYDMGMAEEGQLRAALSFSRMAGPGPGNEVRIGSGVYLTGGDVPLPQVIERPPVEYSDEARRAGISGTVWVRMVITPEGRPRDLVVAAELGYGLDEKAIENVSRCRFQPPTKAGRSVSVQMEMPVVFHLPDYSPGWRLGALLFPALDGASRPVLLSSVRPHFPDSPDPGCNRALTCNPITVPFVVDATGAVRVPGIKLKHPVVDAMDDVLSQWKFEPAKRNGEPVETRGQIMIIEGMDQAHPVRGPALTPTIIGRPGVGGGIGSGASPNSTRPVVVKMVDPEYTDEATRARLEGTVMITLVVDEKGHTRDIRVVRSLGMGLDEKAIEAVRKWIFIPGTRGGQPVAVPATATVVFKLK